MALLLVAQADSENQNICGERALHSAAAEKHREVVKVLLNAEANVNVESERGTALHIARRWGCVETVEILLAAGAID